MTQQAQSLTPHALIISGELDSGKTPLTKAGSLCDFLFLGKWKGEKPGDGEGVVVVGFALVIPL